MENLNIKNYRLENGRIGKGAFSIVYKGYNQHNKAVAIKKVFLEKKKDTKLFIKEFKILRKLNHINIIKVHDVIIEDKNTVYLVLDYFSKGDLSKYLNNRALKEKFAQNYSIQLKNGMQYLFEQNIIHRDLKPQNILVSNDNTLKICDFGFARHFDNNIMLGTICGSPLYMAPEIMNKNKYNSKVDLWSLGIIIYEMLFGVVPFTGKNIFELMKNIKEDKLHFSEMISISFRCKMMLVNLLKIDPDERMTWNDFFENEWFNKNLIEQDENKLLEISFSGNIPNLNNLDVNETKFILDDKLKSFTYKSICNDIDNSLEFNFDLNKDSSSEYSDYKSCDNLSESEKDYFDLNDNDNTISFSSLLEDKEKNIVKSKPINVEKLRYLNDSYVFVSPNAKFINSNKSKSLSESIKEYLSSSLTLVRHGFEYISKSDSL
jgi:serine/threonine protein kinase